MSDYYARTTGKYAIPPNIRRQILYLVRDYDRMVEEAEAILSEGMLPADGMPHGNSRSDEVLRKAAKRESLLRKISAIDRAFDLIPQEYRSAVRANLMYRTRYPDYADRTTFWRYRARFFYHLAQMLNMI